MTARVGLKVYGWSLFFVLPVLGNAENAPSQDLARCAAIAAPAARLACYDALTDRPAGLARPSEVAAAPAAPSSPVAAAPPSSLAPTAANAPVAVAPAASADDPRQFGLSAAQRHVAEVGPKQEKAQIVSVSADGIGHAVIMLDSGQSWAVTDDDGWLSNGEKVVIKRASLGSFLMTTTHRHTYRVHRLQ